MKYAEKDAQKYAIQYERGKDRTKAINPELINKFLEDNSKAFNEISKVLEVKFVDGQPYESCEQMINEVEKTKTLLISKDHNESNILPELDNLKFRAVHDFFT